MKIKKILLTSTIFLFIIYLVYLLNNEKFSNIKAKAYITNQGNNTVSVVDLHKLKNFKTLQVGTAPLGITILKQHNLGFIGNVGSENISVIDTNKDEIIQTIKLNTAPLSLTSRVFVTDWFKNKIIIISVKKLSVINSFTVGKTPSGITFNKKLNYLIVTNRDENTIEIYNGDTYQLINKLATGKHPFGVYTEDKFAYTANVYDDTITIIDLENWSTKTIKVGAHPYNVITHKHLSFVTNTQGDSLSVINLHTNKELKKISTGETPENLDIHQKLNLLVVTNWGSDSINVYDLRNLKLLKEISTGSQSRAFGKFILQ